MKVHFKEVENSNHWEKGEEEFEEDKSSKDQRERENYLGRIKPRSVLVEQSPV